MGVRGGAPGEEKEDRKARAVKKIAMISATLSNSECEKELKALLEFSKPKAGRN